MSLHGGLMSLLLGRKSRDYIFYFEGKFFETVVCIHWFHQFLNSLWAAFCLHCPGSHPTGQIPSWSSLRRYSRSLHFHMNFRISLPLATKEREMAFCWGLHWTVNQFGEFCHFSNIKSSNPEHGMFFCLFRSSLISSTILLSEYVLHFVKFILQGFFSSLFSVIL